MLALSASWLVVTSQVAPVYAEPDDTARVVGSLPVDTPPTGGWSRSVKWVRVHSIDPVVTGWVRRADIAELRR